MKNIRQRATSWTMIAGLVLGIAGQIATGSTASAAALLSDRSLKISSSANGALTNGQSAGQGGNGVAATHTFDFKIATTGNIGAIEIQYCDSAVGTCSGTNIPGMDVTGVSISSQTVTGGSFTLDTGGDAPTNGPPPRIRLTRTAASSTAADQFTLVLGNITNPHNGTTQPNSEDNQTFFARIKTFAVVSGYGGTVIDNGVVAASTAEEVYVHGYVAESLSFCVGTVIGGTDCSGISGYDLLLGESPTCIPDCGILNTSNAAYNRGKSYFRLSTNAYRGVVVSYSADTMKSGTNNIPAVGGTKTSFGASPNGTTDRFGLAFKTTDTNHSFSGLTAATDYNDAQGNNYALDTGSVTSPVTLASAAANTVINGWQTGTIEYRADPKLSSIAAEYSTVATFIATATY